MPPTMSWLATVIRVAITPVFVGGAHARNDYKFETRMSFTCVRSHWSAGISWTSPPRRSPGRG
jgi:hypothetical protein